MQRPKQQAFAFLLGAVLVGGIVGVSADRVFRRDDSTIEAKRTAMYDDLDMATAQRTAMSALFDARNCQYDSIFSPIKPALDSLRAATRARMDQILAPDQRAKLDVRRKDDDARHLSERRRLEAACRK